MIAVAGAGGGLGPHVARALAGAGARLALTDRSEDHLHPLAEQLKAADARPVDLLDEQATRAWAADLTAQFGGVDGLLHLVGGWRGGQPIDESSPEDWALLHDLLIRTVQHTTRAFHSALTASPHGRFVLVSSTQAAKPDHTNAAYGAAKAAAESWTLALASSFADTDATANIVVVNAIVTPQMRAAEPEKAFKTLTDVEEIAEAMVFLCSDAARKMNGQRLHLHA